MTDTTESEESIVYPKAITVKELIELLRSCNPDAPVFADGCDCIGEAVGVERERGYVLISRTIEGLK